MSKFKILSTTEFDLWISSLNDRDRYQVLDRFSRVVEEGYFGDHKSVSNDNSVWEFKWGNGRRVYYAYLKEFNILVLLGGNKNGQDKDVRKAKKIRLGYEKAGKMS